MMLYSMKIKKYYKGVIGMENTLNSQGQIQKTKEELVLDELYSYCSASKAPLVVQLFKIRGIFNKLDEIKYPRYFLHMLNEKSAVEKETPERLYLNSYPYNGEWNHTGLIGYEHLVSSYGLMYRLTRKSFSLWCQSTADKIVLYLSNLGLELGLLLFIPLNFFLCLLCLLSLIAYLFVWLKAKIICTVIKSKVKSKSFRDKNSYELELREKFSQLVDNSINDETKRKRIKVLYNGIILERDRKGRPDDKLFGELLSNEVYQKNLLCIMDLICTTSNPEDHETLRDILSAKTTDGLLEICRKFDSGTNTKNLKIDIDKMMLMHETANEAILSSISNTCKVGDVFSKNTANVGSDLYISTFGARYELINKCTELIKYFQQKKLEADRTGRKIERICRGISPNEHFWSKVRDRFGLNVFNMCIRGKGSYDTNRIDTDPANNLLARLNDGLNNDDKLKIYTPHEGTYFLFDQVTKSKDNDNEVSNYRNSVLTDRGKRITKRVLNLFLPPDYEVEHQKNKIFVRPVNAIASEIDRVIFLAKNDKSSPEYKLSEALSNELDAWVSGFFPNGLPDKEEEFRKKFEANKLSSQNKELLEKALESFNTTFALSVKVDKDRFVDMLSAILYKYTEQIHLVSGDKPHPKEERDSFLKNLRSADGFMFSPIDIINTYAAKYFRSLDEVDKIKNGISDEQTYKLPGKFFEYNENDADCMYTALNYIQVLIQAAIAIVKIDKADAEIRIRFNRNANKLGRMFENETQEADGDYQDLKMKIEKIVLNNPDAKKQEIFVKLLLDGVMDYSENQIQEICDMAQKFTDFDLDNPTREHVTQINCVRANKDAQGNLVGCKFDTKGVLSVEVPDDFQPPQDLQEDLHAQDDVRIVDTGVVLNLFRDMLMNLRGAGLNIPRMAQIINNHLRNDD